MEYYKFMLKSMRNLMLAHKLLVFLMILLISSSLSILGFVLNQGKNVVHNSVDYSETYGKKTYYFTNEGMTDLCYYEYLEDNNVELFQKIKKFKEALLEKELITFFQLIKQPIDIYGCEMKDMFLEGYEEGCASESVFEFEGKNCYITKALQVSDAFFKEFDIRISKGRTFASEDYEYESGKRIAVLLGSGYEDIFQVGDVIECYYLFENVSLEVVGILESESFFFDRMGAKFESCERYIIMPALNSAKINYFSKIMLLQQMEGIIVSDLGYPKTKELFDTLLEKEKIEQTGIYMQDPKATIDASNLLNSYSAMTQEVAKQFKAILCLLLVFVMVSVSNVMCGFIREKNREYGIQMLCGAKPLQIVGDIVLLNFVILMTGFMIALFVLLLNSCTFDSLIWVFVVAVILGGFITVNLYLYLRKMNVSEIIGGKE